ncbi:MAG: heavy metal-responsive transcriptional regulator [Motiliproteus sp.]
MNERKDRLKIGQVAAQAEISVETVRYYEKRGLLQSPHRSESDYREYSPQVLDTLALIARAKALGFSLTEVAELLQLQMTPEIDRSQVKQVVSEKLQLVTQKLEQLQQLKTALEGLSHSCDGHGSVDSCPIISFLKQGDEGAV